MACGSPKKKKEKERKYTRNDVSNRYQCYSCKQTPIMIVNYILTSQRANLEAECMLLFSFLLKSLRKDGPSTQPGTEDNAQALTAVHLYGKTAKVTK